jgi:hypothetical protein
MRDRVEPPVRLGLESRLGRPGSNPHYHQATDRYSTYSDKDFRLGLNAAQTTLATIARFAGATLGK